ncbi:MAG TPA: hypothetical protein VMV36_05965 [Ignavibacteriaceae bacterium]|nr:hypothetical protein [Ignavibacteriaceae bacterium]
MKISRIIFYGALFLLTYYLIIFFVGLIPESKVKDISTPNLDKNLIIIEKSGYYQVTCNAVVLCDKADIMVACSFINNNKELPYSMEYQNINSYDSNVIYFTDCVKLQSGDSLSVSIKTLNPLAQIIYEQLKITFKELK